MGFFFFSLLFVCCSFSFVLSFVIVIVIVVVVLFGVFFQFDLSNFIHIAHFSGVLYNKRHSASILNIDQLCRAFVICAISF